MSKSPIIRVSEGHWHIEEMFLRSRRPGFREYYIQTEQKRPETHAYGIPGEGDRETDLMIGNRTGGGSMYFRDGEDGTDSTMVTYKLPWTFPWKSWDVMYDDDKWGIRVILWTKMDNLFWHRIQWRVQGKLAFLRKKR